MGAARPPALPAEIAPPAVPWGADFTLYQLAKWVKHCRSRSADQLPNYAHLDSLLADLARPADREEPSQPAAKAAKAAASQAPEE